MKTNKKNSRIETQFYLEKQKIFFLLGNVFFVVVLIVYKYCWKNFFIVKFSQFYDWLSVFQETGQVGPCMLIEKRKWI